MARKPHPCHCSPTCEATTLRAFAPGHDAKMATRIARMVVANSLDLDQGKRAILDAGGSMALVRKMLNRVGRAPVAWTRVTEVTVFSERNTLVIQYYSSRAERGLAPWVLHRCDRIGDEPQDAPEHHAEMASSSQYAAQAFWSPEDAVTWQADKCQDRARGRAAFFHVFYANGVALPTDSDEWDPTK